MCRTRQRPCVQVMELPASLQHWCPDVRPLPSNAFTILDTHHSTGMDAMSFSSTSEWTRMACALARAGLSFLRNYATSVVYRSLI